MKGIAAEMNCKMPRLIGLSVLFALLLWWTSLGLALEVNDSCTTPDGKPGQCIIFRDCGPLLQIYGNPTISRDESKFLEQSRCGRIDKRPLVCCAISVDDPRLQRKKETLPKPPFCGSDLSCRRNVGGKTISLDDNPWTALIEYRKPNGSGFHCGATLIHSRYVVTAAHCISNIPNTWQVIGVRLGEWDLDSAIDCLDGDCADKPVDMDIEKIIVHEDYDPQDKAQYNDIALIRFTRDVDMTAFISPVCLPIDSPYRNRNNVGTNGWVVGWGLTDIGVGSGFKKEVWLKFKDLQSCLEYYSRAGIMLRDTQLCVGGARVEDSCSGDSGSPLTKFVQTNNFLYGIASFGPKCGTDDIPGVYTNVAKYIEWIESKLE